MREIIEGLGFKYIGRSIDIWFAKDGTFIIGSWTSRKITMHYGVDDNRLFVVADDRGDEHKLFEGTIKTKDELTVLLKQLGIN